MKRLLVLLGIVFVVLVMQSCSNAHKACNAYAQQESDTRPAADEVQ